MVHLSPVLPTHQPRTTLQMGRWWVWVFQFQTPGKWLARVHLFIKYLMNTCQMPGIILGPGHAMITNNPQIPSGIGEQFYFSPVLEFATDWLRVLLHIVIIFMLGPSDRAITIGNLNSNLLAEKREWGRTPKCDTYHFLSHFIDQSLLHDKDKDILQQGKE